MRCYRVGGAVRDRLLGRPVHERDHVVVGATPDALLALGYRQVGRAFPVFLHPRTGEEYALARERRGAFAPGEVQAGPGVTLRQDLARRDLTINALAEDDAGEVIDYFGGLADLEARLLRHISESFADDPLRVLRVARLAAELAPFGFSVAPETDALMARVVAADGLAGLAPERVWGEWEKALRSPAPRRFIEVLRGCGALAAVAPELARLWGVPQPARHHPEVDTGVHLLLVLDRACELSGAPEVRFAALMHDLGKGMTDPSLWPAHHGHEARGATLVEGFCMRLRVPNRYRDLARAVALHHGQVHRFAELRPATVLKVLEALDAFRRPRRLAPFLSACEADYRGRQGWAGRRYVQADGWRACHAAAAAVRAPAAGAPDAIAERLRGDRLAAIAAAQAESLSAASTGSV